MIGIEVPSGAREPIEVFATEHGGALLRLAYLITGGNSAEAEDLVQSVLLKLIARGLDGIESPLAYARRAMVNEQRTIYRGRQRRLHALPTLAAGGPAQRDPDPVEDRHLVLDALATLRPRERAAVVLRYYEDLPDIEIARILGCSRATVRSLVHRAIPKLQNQLRDIRPRRGPEPPEVPHE